MCCSRCSRCCRRTPRPSRCSRGRQSTPLPRPPPPGAAAGVEGRLCRRWPTWRRRAGGGWQSATTRLRCCSSGWRSQSSACRCRAAGCATTRPRRGRRSRPRGARGQWTAAPPQTLRPRCRRCTKRRVMTRSASGARSWMRCAASEAAPPARRGATHTRPRARGCPAAGFAHPPAVLMQGRRWGLVATARPGVD
ncbi:MAG: hypothetical protein J3K34DRAFT_414898 [Monoraphidium minutum]|nr:MAG: hypothetical protein J3K34DRAFT_414898 [Monoraphidium minutum]